MALELKNFSNKFSNLKRFFACLIIIILVTCSFTTQLLPFWQLHIGVKGETGAPSENGTTTQTWKIEFNDVITRDDETLTTKKIQVEDFGKILWDNITVDVQNHIHVSDFGIFNITNSILDLSGNLNCSGLMNLEDVNVTIIGDINVKVGGALNIKNSDILLSGNILINGLLNLENCKVLVNCSTAGEFFISTEGSGELNIYNNSNISAPSKDLSIRTFFISKNSKIRAENSSFSYLGINSKFSGIKTESNNIEFRNCNFLNSFYALSLVDNSNALVENCFFQNNSIGINLSNSNDHTIKNCDFYENDWSIFGKNANNNHIIGSNFLNNSKIGVYLQFNSNNNIIENSKFENNLLGGIKFNDFSINNTILFCTVNNNSGFGISSIRNSSKMVIEDCTIKNNEYNLKISENTTNNLLINSSLISPGIKDLIISNFSNLKTLNSTFNKSSVEVNFSSKFIVQWFVHIFIKNQTGIPLPDTNISINDSKTGNYKIYVQTNINGWAHWIVFKEYIQTEINKTNLNPFTLEVDKFGYETKITKENIRNFMIINITLKQILIFAPDLVPKDLKFSDMYPRRNQSINIETTIRNKGLINFDNSLTNVTVLLYADDILINKKINLTSINVQDTKELNFNWKVNLSFGPHVIKLMVNPDRNLTEVNYTNNNLSKSLVVNSIPIANLNITPNQARTFENIEFNADSSYNEVKEVKVDSYYFEFGDGDNSSWVKNSVIFHNYTENGNYSARVMVRDESGKESDWSQFIEILILNRQPVAEFLITPSSGKVDTEFDFNAEPSYDLDGSITKYFWNFSDGFRSEKRSLKYNFNDDIKYTISLTVMDNDNRNSEIFVKELKIQNTPPNADLAVSKVKANISEEINFDASKSSDIDDEQELLEFLWDFDDGTFGFNESVISHNFSKEGVYQVTIYVKDDDGNTGIKQIEINITEPTENKTSETNPKDESNLFWIIITGIVLMIILFMVIMLIFINQNKKLRKKLRTENGSRMGADMQLHKGDKFSKVDEFTTAGKMDFVILKRPHGKRYLKFELHQTTKSPTEYVGLIWKSAMLDKSWQVKDSLLDSKENVIDYLQLKVLAYNNKNWVVDYDGNGTILSESFNSKPGQPITIKKDDTGLSMQDLVKKKDEK